MITLPLDFTGTPIPAKYPLLYAGIAEQKAMTRIMEVAKPLAQAAATGIVSGGIVLLIVLLWAGVIP